jgi:benzil reductase ((S)-benzoin forming)
VLIKNAEIHPHHRRRVWDRRCAALAVALSERDCKVIVTGRCKDALDAVASKSPCIMRHIVDVTNRSDRTALAKALADLPAPRAVFHGAGYFQLGQLDALSAADWHRSFDTNVTARWALSQLCAPHLDGGRVLFIGSDAGVKPRVGAAAYSIAQSASETLRRALQAEWAGRDIAIAGFKPRLVNTDMVRGFLAQSETDFPSRAAYQAYIDRRQITTPETVAAFAAWLLLDVDTARLSAIEWDVRHPEHHPEWLDGQLYPATS